MTATSERWIAGYQVEVDVAAHSARIGEMAKVDSETVGEVDRHGRRGRPSNRPSATRGLGRSMRTSGSAIPGTAPPEFASFQHQKAPRRPSQRTGNAEHVPGPAPLCGAPGQLVGGVR